MWYGNFIGYNIATEYWGVGENENGIDQIPVKFDFKLAIEDKTKQYKYHHRCQFSEKNIFCLARNISHYLPIPTRPILQFL